MKNPYAQFMDFQRQAWETATESVETVESLPDAAEGIADVDVAQTPSEVVYEENKLELLHYESRTEEQHDVPLLIVYALVNRPYILDLQPDRSVVRTFLDEGFDVYMIDWDEPSLLDHSLGLRDYVDRYMDNCVDVVRERSDRDAINLLGYCMGAAMSVGYTALYPEKVRNLGLMAGALCFEEEGGLFGQWVQDDGVDVRTIADAYGTIPSEFLDAGFGMGEPIANNVTKHVRFFENLEDEDFVQNFARMERWLDESIDIAGEVLVEFIEHTYQEGSLCNNEFYIGDKHADLDNLDMPIAQVVATYDHIVPPRASTALNEVVPSDDVTVFQADTGHIGLSVSSRAHTELWPEVCEWFVERSQLESELDDEADAPADAAVSDLETIDGIGPAYAERLRAAGVPSVAALAEAEVTELADEADVPVSRLETWVERARKQTT
jgi:polyhydroxyalkanoate synthase